MKKLQKISFLYFFSTLVCLGQNIPKTILWEVSKPGITHKSYLFGTFHEVSPTFFMSLTNTIRKLNASEVVYVEQRFNGVNDTTGTSRLTTWNAEKWNSILVPDQKKVFEDFVIKAEDSSYYRFPPLPLVLSMFRIYAQNFCDTVYTGNSFEIMDSYIEKLALNNRQKVLPLDENQISILTETSEAINRSKDSVLAGSAISLMHQMLNDDNSACEFINEYKNFNLDYQFETAISHTGLPPQFILDRNNKWVSILNSSFENSGCFVAVGLRHLFYKEGLIRQLQKLGYEVKPIPAR